MTTPVVPQIDCEQHNAGPHAKGTLRYIHELKKKHDIDYDLRGSYRLVERK